MLLHLAAGLLFVQLVSSYPLPDGIASDDAVEDRMFLDTIMGIGRSLVGPEDTGSAVNAGANAFGEAARDKLSKAGQIVGKTAEDVADTFGMKNLGAVASSVAEKMGSASGKVLEGGSKLVGTLIG